MTTACANCLKKIRDGTWTGEYLDRFYFLKKPYVKVDWKICPDCRKERNPVSK